MVYLKSDDVFLVYDVLDSNVYLYIADVKKFSMLVWLFDQV